MLTRRAIEQKEYNAGGGVWFRKSDRAQIFVHVRFYPAVRLWAVIDGKEQRITKEELARDYERLRV